MAKNITLLGAEYPDVPAVELPQTGGGTATFTDVGETTATADDVLSGKTFFNSSGVLTSGAMTFESGTNYVKLPDGTMLVWGQATATGLYIDVQFNVLFANTDYAVMVTPVANSNDPINVTVYGKSTYKVRVNLNRPTAFEWLAIGKWK